MPLAAPKLNAFPVFMRVEGQAVVIVGGGEEALAKARLLSQSSAEIRIVADEVEPQLRDWIAANGAVRVHAAYDASLIESAAMVFAATGNEALDRRVAEDARRLRIPVNAVDRPELCDFFTPALVNRAPVAVAIGTEGAGPVLAQMLRARIDQMLPPSLGQLAGLAASFRSAAERLLPKGNRRRAFWSGFFGGAPARAVASGDIASAHEEAARLLLSEAPASGHIALVGAGPGAEDLLTLRAQRLLMEADAIVHDALVPEAVVLDVADFDKRQVAGDLGPAGQQPIAGIVGQDQEDVGQIGRSCGRAEQGGHPESGGDAVEYRPFEALGAEGGQTSEINRLAVHQRQQTESGRGRAHGFTSRKATAWWISSRNGAGR